MKDHTEVKVVALPKCNTCAFQGRGTPNLAHYDGKTTMGPWANMCEECFQEYGVGLGLGKGQRLVVKEHKPNCDCDVCFKARLFKKSDK